MAKPRSNRVSVLSNPEQNQLPEDAYRICSIAEWRRLLMELLLIAPAALAKPRTSIKDLEPEIV